MVVAVYHVLHIVKGTLGEVNVILDTGYHLGIDQGHAEITGSGRTGERLGFDMVLGIIRPGYRTAVALAGPVGGWLIDYQDTV